jgi:ribosome biogenesis GTPase
VVDPGDLLEPYRQAGYPVHETSARDRAGLEPLRDALAGRTSLLLGPSGTGKSTLVNVLFGANLATGEVSRSTSKGVHTTTRVEWIDLPCGGAVLDSPGIRSIHPAGLRRGTLAACFPELRKLEPCQFADCLHRGEAGCAAAAAIRDGRLPAARHESYLRLLKTLPA